MKKLIFVLAVLVSSPVFALVVDLNDIGSGQVAIQYRDADPCNLPRMFALDITIDIPGQFTAISGYKADGESNAISPGYGIYPARIDINDNGDVDDYGSPLAYSGDPGAGNGIPSNHIVLEFGSLYYDDVNSPLTSGTLCVLDYSCDAAMGLTITMTDEDTYRKGLVFEDITLGDVNDSLIVCYGPPCLKDTAVEYADWVAWGSPACWCYKRQCRGDADGIKVGPFHLNALDFAILKAAFNKQDAALALVPNGICADFNHTKTGPFRVSALDMMIFKTYFNKQEILVPCCDMSPTDCVLTAGDKWNFWTN